MKWGHREAARSVLDGREHDGNIAAEGRKGNRPRTLRHRAVIAVYVRVLVAANTRATCPGR